MGFVGAFITAERKIHRELGVCTKERSEQV